jgi:Rne/Rng family ribonuclease
MNKELFVSSTPHETKVGLVEDDLLAEIYLERENEYTLAGSIYKGRVTRVLPGMQSAFVDIGLERDAFLYVSDFMELEEQDEDLTDAVPATRAVHDLRPQPARAESAPVAVDASEAHPLEGGIEPVSESEFAEGEAAEAQPVAPAAGVQEEGTGSDGQNRERGGWRGRRRRRGGRRDGRGDGRERGFDRGADRGPDRSADRGSDRGLDRGAESRFARPESPRASESGRTQPAGPPPGYTPIMLPGESISKYQRFAQTQRQAPPAHQHATEVVTEEAAAPETPIAAAFPDDEPIFASAEAVAEPLHEEHEHEVREEVQAVAEEPAESASTSTDWNHEFRRAEEVSVPALGWPGEERASIEVEEVHEAESDDSIGAVPEHTNEPVVSPREDETPVFAAPGTMEEETIDEEEADAIRYESSSDEGYDEFEEETRAAGPEHLNGEAREVVSEIHQSLLSELGHAEAGEAHAAEGTPAEGEDDSEELELEEAQAEAEAMLDAEARGNGTVDARVEVRAPAATAGYTQRAPRPAWERRGQRGRRGGPGGGGGRRFRRRESSPVPLISDLLKEGQEILVQIAKEPIGKKGARITSHIALPGRFLVYMPTVNHTGVSRKIASEEERQRLKRIIQSERENGHGGFIVRTAAQNASEDELRADIRFLKGLWQDIKNRAENSKPPALIYHDLNVVERVLRDQVTSDFNVIWVDTEPEYERVLRFFNRFQPALVKRVKLYTKETPLFEQFGLAEEMNKALKSKVWLKSGGYIVINQTEALVAIDINTGKYVGKTQRLEDTIVKTNVDAIKEIVRQIRLRDLGGIIIIDFIDMDERRNRQRVMQALEEELRHDRAPSKTLQFNDFGLVAITRKRVKQSLERTIGAPCPYCESTGYVKSVTTVCNEIYVEMRKIAKHLEHEDVMLRVHPDVAKELKSNNGRLLNEMEELTKRTIIVKSDPAIHQQQFDIN